MTDSEIYDPVNDEWTSCGRPCRGHASASYHVVKSQPSDDQETSRSSECGDKSRVSECGDEATSRSSEHDGAHSVYIVGGLSDRGPSAGVTLLQLS